MVSTGFDRVEDSIRKTDMIRSITHERCHGDMACRRLARSMRGYILGDSQLAYQRCYHESRDRVFASSTIYESADAIFTSKVHSASSSAC